MEPIFTDKQLNKHEPGRSDLIDEDRAGADKEKKTPRSSC